VAEAGKQGIIITTNQVWDTKQPGYTGLFTSIRSAHPDCVYVGGIFDNNGGQLVKDKVRVLGDNRAVKLIGPDGFSGYSDLDNLAEAQGMYLTFAGLSIEQVHTAGGKGAQFLDDYKARYGADLSTPDALYGVAALQVILAAIGKSDGTRKGVRDAVFAGDGITVSASVSVLGKSTRIDPASGDVGIRDVSVLRLDGTVETFLQARSVS
jgi:branched-chain amino acid transport system substrate-binding protein